MSGLNNDALTELRETFDSCDLNGDGFISPEEFHALLIKLDGDVSREECLLDFDVADTEGDGMNASVLPLMSVASLVGFGSVVAALPAFATARDWVLGIEGGPLVGLAVATNVLAALTGSASGGLTIALGALGDTYMEIASTHGIDPGLMHRVAVIGAGTLDSLPHNGAVVTLLAVCGATHKSSYLDIVVAGIIGPIIALTAVILLGSLFGSF